MQDKCTKRTRHLQRRRSTATDAFRQSRFYTTILLVLNFLIFIIVPDLTYMFHGMDHDDTVEGYHTKKNIVFEHSNHDSNVIFDLSRLSYAVASTINFFIYIFVQPAVRGVLDRKCWRRIKIRLSRSDKRQQKISIQSGEEVSMILLPLSNSRRNSRRRFEDLI